MSVSSEVELREAINNAEAGVSVVIAFEGDIQLTGAPLVISANKHITLTSSSEEGFFKLIGASGVDTINIIDGGLLKLDGVIVTHANGVMGRGVNISAGCTLVMSDGEIVGNTSANGGGVYINAGSFTLSGGKISGNAANNVGGGVCNFGGSFTLLDGIISGNTATSGGGVYNNVGNFTMHSGTISDNNADCGGGVYNNGNFILLGGTISDNNAAFDGGGIFLSNGFAELSGSTISGNTASGDGGGVWVDPENLDKLRVINNMIFSNNRTTTACNRATAQDQVYIENITDPNVTWTAPFTQGYNNYDISNTNGAPLKYNVTVENSFVAVELSGGGSYSQNASITINAGTRPGYTFTGWTVKEGDINLSNNLSTTVFVMPATNVVVVANWKMNEQYNVTVNGVEDEQLSDTGSYPEGVTVAINAGTKQGHTFTGWTVKEGDITLPNTLNTIFIMPGKNVVITANWQAREYNVIVNDSYTTTSATSGAGKYIQGQTVTINAGTKPDYTFIGWTVNEGDITPPNNPNTTFTMPAKNVIITANWKANEYSVTINESYAESSGTGNYPQGIAIIINAGTRPDHTFTGWTVNEGDITPPNNPNTTFTMPAKNVTIKANWKINEYTVTVNNINTTTPTIETYAQGQIVTINAGTKPNHTFTGWTINKGDITLLNTPNVTFIMPKSDVVITANWKADNEHSVTVNESYAESTGTKDYIQGQTVTINAGTKPNHTFTGWTINKGDITLPNSNTPITSFVMPSTDVVITANWEIKEYHVTIEGILAALTLTAGAGKYLPGATVTIKAEPVINQIFTEWTVKEGDIILQNSNSNTTTFTMPAKNVTIKANWKIPEPIKEAVKPVTDALVNSTRDLLGAALGNITANLKTDSTYNVSIIDGGITSSGTGRYSQGTRVTINAGTKQGDTFTGWTITEGNIILQNSNSNTTTFTMPAKNVTIKANWRGPAKPPHVVLRPGGGIVPPRT
jgi:uncharacterized repeat protein (TIGR02543 family)